MVLAKPRNFWKMPSPSICHCKNKASRNLMKRKTQIFDGRVVALKACFPECHFFFFFFLGYILPPWSVWDNKKSINVGVVSRLLNQTLFMNKTFMTTLSHNTQRADCCILYRKKQANGEAKIAEDLFTSTSTAINNGVEFIYVLPLKSTISIITWYN